MVETFRWPPLTIGMFVVALVVFSGITVWFMVEWAAGAVPLGFVLIFAGFALMDVWVIWISLERIDADAIGITWKRPGQESRHLNWSEICRVRERPIGEALELEGEAGRPRIPLRYILANFSRLRALVLAKVPQLGAHAADAGQTSLPLTFRKSVGPFIFLGGSCLFCLGLGIAASQSELLAALGLCAFGLLLLGILVWSWHSLTVDHDRIILHALIRRREILLAEIIATRIEDIASREYGIKTGGQMNLVLDLKEGKPLRLGYFKDQTLFARELIEVARKAQSLGTRSAAGKEFG